MTRTIYDNGMVAHIWAHQSQSDARSHNGNFHFSGPVIWSYRTPLASIVESSRGRVALVTSNSYSVTTSGKHMPAIWRALDYGRYIRAFTVPFVHVTGFDAGRHPENLAHLVARYAEQVASYRRRRQIWGDPAETLREAAQNAVDYAEAFDLPAPSFDRVADTASILAHHAAREARNADPVAQAKRERERARRAERKAEQDAAAAAERLKWSTAARAAWLAGENPPANWYGRLVSDNGGALLRVRGENVETSLRATVPLAHAVRAFRFIKLCRERGEAWQRNGHSIRVGHFTVDRIAPSGDFHAGCHFIEWSEVERVARQIGVFDETASADALQETADA